MNIRLLKRARKNYTFVVWDGDYRVFYHKTKKVSFVRGDDLHEFLIKEFNVGMWTALSIVKKRNRGKEYAKYYSALNAERTRQKFNQPNQLLLNREAFIGYIDQ